METVVKMIFSSIKLYGTAYISFITKVYTYSFCAHSYYLFLYLVKTRYLKHSNSILCMIYLSYLTVFASLSFRILRFNTS